MGREFGYLTRRYGWTCDNVVSMEVITAEGERVHASADENRDLFWGLRGGGGNFGIVTNIQHRLYPVGPQITGGIIAGRAEEADATTGSPNTCRASQLTDWPRIGSTGGMSPPPTLPSSSSLSMVRSTDCPPITPQGEIAMQSWC